MIPPRTRKRRGLTLVELLVALAVIGVLAALLIPAAQTAREVSRRARCANNLRQIGLALASYQGSAGVLPLGNSHNLYSIHTSILPFLEQGDLFNSINFAFDAFLPPAENLTVARVTLDVMLCPSDVCPSSERRLGCTSYAGNRGVGVQRFGYNGAFATSFQPPIGPASFLDGASNTVAMAEHVLGEGEGIDSRRVVLRPPSALIEPGQFEQFIASCRELDANRAKRVWRNRGMNWIAGEFGFTLYNHSLVPNERSCLNGTYVQEGAWTAGSFHPGVVNVLFVDGHVRPMNTTLAPPVWWALGSRNGKETIDESALQ